MAYNMAEQLWSEISRINNNHISKLSSKFISQWNKICWKDLGRTDLLNHISSINLSSVENEALSFGLKIASGIKNHDMGKLINTNDSGIHKGFIQGIIAASTNCHSDELTLPNRYITAWNISLLTTTSLFPILTKAGCIMDSTVYKQKLMGLLGNNITYEQISLQTVSKNINDFKKSCRKLISNEDKSWVTLINYHPIIPKIYGLPITHKPNIPLRPIISGIGSAPPPA